MKTTDKKCLEFILKELPNFFLNDLKSVLRKKFDVFYADLQHVSLSQKQ